MTSAPPECTLLVYLYDRERDLRTAFKTRGRSQGGSFDGGAWCTGEFACDCVRGAILYGGGTFCCGVSRFRVETVFEWDSGTELRVDPGAEAARCLPAGHAGPAEATATGAAADRR